MKTATTPTQETRRKLSIALKKAWAEGKRKIHPNTFNNFKTLNKGKSGDAHPASGSKHPAWQGENVGYHALHSWVSRRKGKPDTCEHCKLSGLYGQKIHWANVNGEYKRNVDDWIRLCALCHRRYDDRNHLRNLAIVQKKR